MLIIIDLQGNAYGLAALSDSNFEIPAEGEKSDGNAVVISSGTGLGEAGMYWDWTNYHPYATEGGHCNFSPTNLQDVELWKYLKDKFDHVSW